MTSKFERNYNAKGIRNMRKILRSDIENDFPEEKDGSAIRGFIFSILFMAIVSIIFLLSFFLFSTKAHAQTASWYGVTGDTCDKWKHTVTANGEKFNENSLTAASWKYKFGTRLLVTNLINHKQVVVRVTDRGPSKSLVKKGRIIDLSRGAFQKIADLKIGVIPVEVICLK